MRSIQKAQGFGIAEIVIASSIISTVLVILVSVYNIVSYRSLANVEVLKATGLTEEGVEVLKYLGNSGWTKNIASLTNGSTYYLYFDANVGSGTWTATTSNIRLENKYQVSFVLSPVYRDANFGVVSYGGTVDNGSRKAIVTVTYNTRGATTTKQIEAYLFNLFSN